MYRTVACELALRCVRCNGEFPVAALADELRCPQCTTPNRMPWRGLFDLAIRGAVVALDEVLPGLTEGRAHPGASHGVVLAITGAALRCACGAPFTDAQIAGINRLHPRLRCAACALDTPARRPPDALAAAYPNLVAVLGEGAAPEGSPRVGVVIRCGECGALLDSTGDASSCSHCGAVNHRPPGAGAITAHPRITLVFRAAP